MALACAFTAACIAWHGVNRHAMKKRPKRIVAGAPVKHAPMPVKVELWLPGVWIETYADEREVVVADLTSALWRAKRA